MEEQLDRPEPEVNPLVSELLAAGPDKTTSLEGFVGSVEQGVVRIYADLGLNHYIEVPATGVVRVLESRTPKEPAVLVLRRDVALTYVQTHQKGGISLTQSMTTSIDALDVFGSRDATPPIRPSAPNGANGCGCGPSPVQTAARQSGGGPEVSICTWSCQERFLLCLQRSGPLRSLWCYLNYGLCRLGCEIPPIILV